MVKLIAYYLPQFHEIPENNLWWGKGFTEWSNCKNSKPLFKGHRQPNKPLNDNYYNLLDPSVMEEQMKLAKKFGVYGFCFYHYWFCGKQMLEKPVDNLLTTDFKIPYCLAWANESWTKTWHGSGGANKILMSQSYGKEDDWIKHIEYLLKFFKDYKYIKISNKPVLLIYNVEHISCKNKMFECWERIVKKNGFKGLFLIGMKKNNSEKLRSKYINATVDFEPRMSRSDSNKFNGSICQNRLKYGEKLSKLPIIKHFLYTTFSYDKINQSILRRPHRKNEFRGIFTNYDDTPRRHEWALLFKGSTPEKFEYYLKENLKKSISEENEYIFINAWNEWGEGAYLEPDKFYGYGYLKAIFNVMCSRLTISQIEKS